MPRTKKKSRKASLLKALIAPTVKPPSDKNYVYVTLHKSPYALHPCSSIHLNFMISDIIKKRRSRLGCARTRTRNHKWIVINLTVARVRTGWNDRCKTACDRGWVFCLHTLITPTKTKRPRHTPKRSIKFQFKSRRKPGQPRSLHKSSV